VIAAELVESDSVRRRELLECLLGGSRGLAA